VLKKGVCYKCKIYSKKLYPLRLDEGIKWICGTCYEKSGGPTHLKSYSIYKGYRPRKPGKPAQVAPGFRE